MPSGVRSSGARSRRRDRRGRGLRGPLVPVAIRLPGLAGQVRVPLSRTRADRFDDLVLDAVERLEQRWGDRLADVEFAVEDVPPVGPDGVELPASAYDDGPVPLARLLPGQARGPGRRPPRIVVYRRPIEARALDAADRADLILDAVVEQVADLLALPPEEVDPEYGERW